LTKPIEALTEQIPDLTDTIQRLQDDISKTAQNTSEYITITEKLNAIQSGEIGGVKEGDIDRLAAQRQKLFSQFDPQTRGLISEANKKGDVSELRRIEATVNRINNTRLSGLQVLSENKSLKKNLSFQGTSVSELFTKGGLDNPLIGGGPFSAVQGGASALGINTGPNLGRSIQRTYANRNLIQKQGFFSNLNPVNAISNSIAATQLRNVISDSEIKTQLQDARQRSLASKSNFSQLTSFSNIKGESLFELISKDAGAQKQIAGAQSFSDISKSLTDLAGKNDIKGVNEFLEQLKLIDPDPKSMELLNRLFKIQFSPQRIEQAVKDEQVRQVNQDKTNKLISESSIGLIKFADSLERVGADLSILNSGKLIDLEKTFNLEKIKLNLENSIKGLNAGDYEKERLNLNQQTLSNRQSRDISIEKLRADTNEALLDKIQGFTSRIQTTFVRDQIKLNENAGSDAVDTAIEKTTSKLKGFFDSVGLSNIDIKTFDGYALTDGTDMRSIFKSIQNAGALDYRLFDNDTTLPLLTYSDRKTVSLEMRNKAKPHIAEPYAFVSDLTFSGLKRAIYQYKGVILLLKIGKEFWTNKEGKSSWKEKDILPLRPPEKIVSGHFVVAHSFDENRIYFSNSFSTDWGQKGHGYFEENYMPYVISAGTTIDVPDTKEESYLFTRQLDFGDTGVEVQELQKRLQKLGYFPESQPATQYFGTITQSSVKKYQCAKGIVCSGTPKTTGWGRVGNKTMKSLNES